VHDENQELSHGGGSLTWLSKVEEVLTNARRAPFEARRVGSSGGTALPRHVGRE
jgi:hypothetical protein